MFDIRKNSYFIFREKKEIYGISFQIVPFPDLSKYVPVCVCRLMPACSDFKLC